MTPEKASSGSDSPSSAFLRDALEGLSRAQRELPCKYLYDERGSELFEAICDTGEYYVTRADLALHETHLNEIVGRIGPEAHIVEFGSGAGIKIRSILAACERPRAYTPIEISGEALEASVSQLAEQFPGLEIRPLEADYTQPVPDKLLALDPPARRRVVYFPGSTISNFTHAEAGAFLTRMRRIAGTDGGVLIGVDLVKDATTLRAAYDDAGGVTAAFNLNLLHRLRNELGATLDPDAFTHEARWNPDERRIEMHLVASRPTRIELDGRHFEFEAGESIHTENSHKYSIDDFRRLAEQSGFGVVETWTDPDGLFSMHYLESSDSA